MTSKRELEDALMELNDVSRECAAAYIELVEWEAQHGTTFADEIIMDLASAVGWSAEETMSEWGIALTVKDFIAECDEYVLHCLRNERSLFIRELLYDPADGTLAVLALATLIDVLGATDALNMVRNVISAQIDR